MTGAGRVRLLGEFRFEGVDLSALRSRQARTFLKVLAVHRGAPVVIDRLVDIIWGAEWPADPAAALAVLASRARNVVGTQHIVRRDGAFALSVGWYDVDELDELTREASRRLAADDPVGGRVAVEKALALVRGPLLADEPAAEWLDAARVRVDELVAEARMVAAAAALATGRAADAVRHARDALAHDPFDERALCALMTALVAAGRPASALAAYGEARHRLADELGVDPSPETRALHAEILAGTDAPTPGREHPEPPPPTRATLVGRDRELAALDDASAAARRGAEVVVVVGEPGIGKTALLDAWAAAAAARGTVVVRASAEHGGSLPLGPLLAAFGGHPFAATESAEPTGVAAALAALARGGGPAATAHPGVRLPAAVLRAQVFAAMDDVAARLAAATAGLAVLLDDVHAADDETIAWLGHAAGRGDALRVLVVATRRDDGPVPFRYTRRLDLGPLDRAAVDALAGPRAAELYARTAGHPLLLTELLAAGADERLPPTLVDAVALRLRACGSAATTLQSAAVLGAGVDLDLLAAVLHESPLAVLADLDEGVRHGFLVSRDGDLEFRHELVRDVLASGMSPTRRAWLHREAARHLAGRDTANPLALAAHARAAGDAAGAAAALVRAADVSVRRLDLAGAERLLDEAIELDERLELRLRRGRLRLARGDLAGADDDATAAMALGGGARALELRAWTARYRHDMDAAIRLGEAGAAIADDDVTKASCLLATAFAHRGQGDLYRADALMVECGALAPPDALGLGGALGTLRVHQGRPAEALALLEPLLGSPAPDVHSFFVEHLLQMTAHAHGLLGHAQTALEVVDRLEMELDRRGSTARYGGLVHTYRSWIRGQLGDPAAADLAATGVDVATSAEIRTQSRLDLAVALLAAGRTDAAGDALDAATAELGARWFHNRWRAAARAGVIAAELHLRNGDPMSAIGAAGEVVTAAEERGDSRYATLARLLLCRACARMGERFDVDACERDLLALRHVAGLEAWRVAASVAADTGSRVASIVADRAVATVAADAGPYGELLADAAARALTS